MIHHKHSSNIRHHINWTNRTQSNGYMLKSLPPFPEGVVKVGFNRSILQRPVMYIYGTWIKLSLCLQMTFHVMDLSYQKAHRWTNMFVLFFTFPIIHFAVFIISIKLPTKFRAIWQHIWSHYVWAENPAINTGHNRRTIQQSWFGVIQTRRKWRTSKPWLWWIW